MHKAINKNEFHEAFNKAGRDCGWTYEGLNTLYAYLEECGDFELDVIAIDSEWEEWDCEEAYNYFSQSYDDCPELNASVNEWEVWFAQYTIVAGTTNTSIIVASF